MRAPLDIEPTATEIISVCGMAGYLIGSLATFPTTLLVLFAGVMAFHAWVIQCPECHTTRAACCGGAAIVWAMAATQTYGATGLAPAPLVYATLAVACLWAAAQNTWRSLRALA